MNDDEKWQPRGDETYWGEPTSDAERKLVDSVGDSLLYQLVTKGV